MGHWYDTAGNACHTVIGKNGKERATTLKDAKTKDLVPGVTTIIRQLDKSWLTTYKINEVLKAVLEFDRHADSNYKFKEQDKWKAIILSNADQDRDEAAIKGSNLHKELENYIKTKKYNEKSYLIIKPVINLLDKEFPNVNFESEKTFRSEGYGGSIDLVSLENKIIIDFKGKKDKFFETAKFNNIEYMIQLAAYKFALSKHDFRCYNLFISYDTPGKYYLHRWTTAQIEQGYKMFLCLRDYWALSNGVIL